MVGAIGFEPTTSWSQTRRSTRLSYTPPIEPRWDAGRQVLSMTRNSLPDGLAGVRPRGRYCLMNRHLGEITARKGRMTL